ncbi:MAG: DUF4381 domain-containing protein [Lysobacterales bacterium]|jgi:hypothetical protein
MNPDLLAQLRDIHTSPELPWWPPAPGWWVLALLLSLAMIWLARRALQRYRVRQRRRHILAWVDGLQATMDAEQNPQAFLSTLNQIFKIVALQAFPGHLCAQLSGSDWVDFLREQIGDAAGKDALVALATGPYEPAPGFDAVELCELTRAWIRRHG